MRYHFRSQSYGFVNGDSQPARSRRDLGGPSSTVGTSAGSSGWEDKLGAPSSTVDASAGSSGWEDKLGGPSSTVDASAATGRLGLELEDELRIRQR